MRGGNKPHLLVVGGDQGSSEDPSVVDVVDSDFEVTTVATARDAVARLGECEETFDCVVSEFDLPDGDGLFLLESVKRVHETIPVILKRTDTDGFVADAIAADATDFYRLDGSEAAGRALANRIEKAIGEHESSGNGLRIHAEECRMAESSAEIVTAVDDSGTIRAQCAAVTDVLGYDPDALVGVDVLTLVHPEDRERFRSTTRALLDGEEMAKRIEFRVRNDDDSIQWLDAVVSNAAKPDDGYVLISRDVTGRIEYERELERQRELLHHTEELASTGGWEADLETGTQRWTRGTRRLHEVPDDFEPTIENGIDFYHPEDRETIEEKVRRCWHAGESFDVELRLITANDNLRWVRAIGVPVRDDGEITRLRGAIRDVTKRKEREQQLRRFEEAVENSGHAVFITDVDGTIEYVNSAFETITGYDAEDALGESPSLLASGEMSEEFFEDLWETILDRKTWEGQIVNRRADGESYYAHQTVAPILADGEPTAFVAVQQDVTERRERERELDRAREKLRTIIDLIPDPIFVKNREGEYILANKAIADLYGETPDTVEGKTDFGLNIPEETARRFAEEDREVIDSNRPMRNEAERIRSADGSERVFETIKIPYDLETDDGISVLGYARDITDLKEREEVLETQRDDLDVLNQMVRHDIRNDLQLVHSYAELLEEHVEGDPADYLDIVEERAEKAIELTQTARELAAILLHEEIDPQGMSLEEPIAEQVEALRSSFPEANIEIDSPISDARVVADELAEAIVRNLVQNAVNHNDKPTPVVSVSTEERSGSLRLLVADNGPGIPDGKKENIFGQGEKGLESDGTGIGLYLVARLVDRYGGDVWVEDNDPKGSVFVVEFPIAD